MRRLVGTLFLIPAFVLVGVTSYYIATGINPLPYHYTSIYETNGRWVSLVVGAFLGVIARGVMWVHYQESER